MTTRIHSRDRDADICWICHEIAPDAPPPCRRIDTLMFHQHCLHKLVRLRYHAEGYVACCPHCNTRIKDPAPITAPSAHIEETARTSMQRRIESWPAINLCEGFWHETPSFLCIQTGRLLSAEEAMAAVRGMIMAVMTTIHLHSCNQLHHSSFHDHTTGRHSICIRDDNVELGVCFERVAIVGALGRIKYDGYLTGAYRRKIGLRRVVVPEHRAPPLLALLNMV